MAIKSILIFIGNISWITLKELLLFCVIGVMAKKSGCTWGEVKIKDKCTPMDTKQQISTIRKIVKGKTKTVSVRNGQGTAWGWVEISGSGDFGNFTDRERIALRSLNIKSGGNFALISPENRASFIEKHLG